MNTTELAEQLNLKPGSIYYWLRRTGFQPAKIEGRLILSPAEFELLARRIRQLRGEAKGFLSVKEAAQRLEIKESTVWSLIRMYKLDHVRIERHVRIPEQEVRRYAAERR